MHGRRQWAALLPLLALAGCGGAGAGEGGGEQAREPAARIGDPILAADSPVALTPYWPEGGAAMISGRLVIEGGCLYLRDADGGRILPTFPWPGTQWQPETGRISIFGRINVGVGEQLTAGGGFATQAGADSGNAAALQRMLVVPRPQCDTSRVAVLYFGEAPGGSARQ